MSGASTTTADVTTTTTTTTTDVLADLHPIVELDGRLVFDEATHTYSECVSDGHCYDISVTEVVNQFFPVVDADAFIARVRKAGCLAPRYRRMTNDKLKAAWMEEGDGAVRDCRAMHRVLERLFKGGHWQSPDYGLAWALADSPRHAVELTQFAAFYARQIARRGLVPFRAELGMADDTTRVAGTLDAVFVCPADGHLELYNWKRNRRSDVDDCSAWTKALLTDGPLVDLSCCHLSMYSLELNLYKCILERNAPSLAPITRMWLVFFHPDQAVAEIIKVPTMTPAADWMLETTAARRQSTPKQ